MREFINIIRIALREGEVVDMKAHKFGKAVDGYGDAIQGIVGAERDFFSTGKFAPFAKTYIDSGFDPKMAPTIELEVGLRDERPSAEARALLAQLRAERFKMVAATKRAKGTRPPPNPDQHGLGAFGTKLLTISEARDIFAGRENSPYGAYRRSRRGFRTDALNDWDARGAGFSIIVGGHDSRREDKYGSPTREEHHIIDDDKDMAEVSHMFALIARARMAKS